MKNNYLLTAFQALLFFAISAVSSASWAALPAYICMSEFPTDVNTAGREECIEVVGFGYNVSIPTDSSSGLPAGTRQYRPIRILKDVDKASPLLFQAMVSGVNLSSVPIMFYRSDSVGAEEHFYTVTLGNARIVSIMPSHTASVANEPMREAVSFVFQTITVTHESSGTEVSDTYNP